MYKATIEVNGDIDNIDRLISLDFGELNGSNIDTLKETSSLKFYIESEKCSDFRAAINAVTQALSVYETTRKVVNDE